MIGYKDQKRELSLYLIPDLANDVCKYLIDDTWSKKFDTCIRHLEFSMRVLDRCYSVEHSRDLWFLRKWSVEHTIRYLRSIKWILLMSDIRKVDN